MVCTKAHKAQGHNMSLLVIVFLQNNSVIVCKQKFENRIAMLKFAALLKKKKKHSDTDFRLIIL